jgi:hypothetical protein
MSNHIADAGKMLWDNEPTPLADESAVEEYSPRLKLYVDLETARNIERRMRASELLLRKTINDSYLLFPDHDILVDEIKAHLEAARKEDGK